MTFWNGTEWTAETPPTPPQGREGRAAAWIATLIMVASLGLYAVPFADTSASGPTLTLSPTSGVPGTKVVVGHGPPLAEGVREALAAAYRGLPEARATR